MSGTLFAAGLRRRAQRAGPFRPRGGRSARLEFPRPCCFPARCPRSLPRARRRLRSRQSLARRNSVHDGIGATYSTFKRDGRRFIQVDSYGRAEREIPGKKSQSFQLDEKSARALFEILRDTFHFR
jgi:hypothetical protein